VIGLKSSWRSTHDELDADWDDRGTAVSAGGLCDGEGSRMSSAKMCQAHGGSYDSAAQMCSAV